MSDDTARIRIKIGHLEVECEGDSSFLQDDLFNLLKKAASLYAENKALIPAEPAGAAVGTQPPANQTGKFGLTTNSMAAQLKAGTGPELAIAAAAHLTLVKRQGKFTRKQINGEMKNAARYYKSSMSGNLTKTLVTLVKNKRLNEVGKGTYALSATERQALKAKLAQ